MGISALSWRDSIDRLKEGCLIFPWNSRVRVFQGLLHISSDPLIKYTSTVRKGQDRENQAIHGWREPSHLPDSWGTGRETSPSDRTEGHSGTWRREPSNARGDSVRPGTPGGCR